jgi:hypothetical protein
MPGLVEILKGVNWADNIEQAYSDVNTLEAVEKALMRVAIWSKQLEITDFGNPALSFVREMQVAAHQSAALLGLCVYKASAASSRTLVETCLYYTYFRTHPEELATLVRSLKYYVTKDEVIEFHKLHTPEFIKCQEVFGLIGNLSTWYSRISAVVHGQIPGAWRAHESLEELGFDGDTHGLALESFLEGEELVHQALMCTSGRQLWDGFTPDAKSHLIKGIAGEKRAQLGLDLK